MIHLKKLWENSKVILLFIFIGIIDISCASQNGNKQIKTKLFRENNNVFYMSSTYINREIVWSYTSSDIVIYTLSTKGEVLKIRRETLISPFFTHNLLIPTDSLNTCIELDGDYWGYKIYYEGQKIEKEHFTNIKCFLQNQYQYSFYNKLREDMVKYNIILYK